MLGRNAVMRKALGATVEEEHKPGCSVIANQLEGDVGLLFTSETPQVVLEWFESYKVPDYARAGNLATEDFVLPEGAVQIDGENAPHSLEPQLRKLGLPTRLLKGIPTLSGEHRVCKEGQKLSPDQAHLLKLFHRQMATVCRFLPDVMLVPLMLLSRSVPDSAKDLRGSRGGQGCARRCVVFLRSVYIAVGCHLLAICFIVGFSVSRVPVLSDSCCHYYESCNTPECQVLVWHFCSLFPKYCASCFSAFQPCNICFTSDSCTTLCPLSMPSERYARLDEPAIRWLDQSGRFTVGPIKELDGAIFEFEGIEHPNGRLAVQMLTQSGIAKTTFQSLRILDNGCGSASISSAIQQARAAHTTSKGSLTPPWTTRPCQIVAGVSSTDIRIFSKEELQDTAKRRGWVDQTIENIDMQVGKLKLVDALPAHANPIFPQSLRFPSRSFTHVFTNLSLLFCQDDDAAVKGISDVTA